MFVDGVRMDEMMIPWFETVCVPDYCHVFYQSPFGGSEPNTTSML